MPIIEVTLGEGRSPEMLRALQASLAEAAVASLGVRKESVRVILREVPLTHFLAGDETLAERKATAQAQTKAKAQSPS